MTPLWEGMQTAQHIVEAESNSRLANMLRKLADKMEKEADFMESVHDQVGYWRLYLCPPNFAYSLKLSGCIYRANSWPCAVKGRKSCARVSRGNCGTVWDMVSFNSAILDLVVHAQLAEHAQVDTLLPSRQTVAFSLLQVPLCC